MDLLKNEINQCLEDLDISEEKCERCKKMVEFEEYEQLYRDLRCIRAEILDDIHLLQKKLDHVDCLIYSIKKERMNKDHEI